MGHQATYDATHAILSSHPVTHQAIALVKQGANQSAKLQIAKAIEILAGVLASLD